jgi:hypothetical protein
MSKTGAVETENIQEIYNSLPKTYQSILFKLAKKMKQQSDKGKEKYGYTMDDNTNPDPKYWQNHFLEEMADGLVYIEKLLQILGKDRLK